MSAPQWHDLKWNCEGCGKPNHLYRPKGEGKFLCVECLTRGAADAALEIAAKKFEGCRSRLAGKEIAADLRAMKGGGK